MEVGWRVIRGPDWQWGEQDGGEGCVGTVAEVLDGAQEVVVLWDLGGRCKYRCGEGGQHDLRLLDSAPAGTIHPGVQCIWCEETPITGIVWKCAFCYGYSLCTCCYMADKHSADHPFDRCLTKDHKKRVRVPPRFMAPRIPVMGMFPGAEVVRGCDWRWKDQDGGKGNVGRVTKIQGWKKDTFRSVAVVIWQGAEENNVYRRGHRGKVDLKCVTAADGGHCYVEHLPLLGEDCTYSSEALSAGDAVVVQLNPDLFKAAQEDHGGWIDTMAENIGEIGEIITINTNKNLIVIRYYSGTMYHLNKDIVTKVDVPLFHEGDVVRVLDDMLQVYSLQEGHGEWNDDMSLSLGQVGRVLHILPNYDVRVAVNERSWKFNPKCLEAVSWEDSTIIDEDVSISVSPKQRLELQAILNAGLPEVVPLAAEAGDVETLTKYLEKNPQDVNHRVKQRGALHEATLAGFTSAVKAILGFNADVNIKDDTAESPLHYAARRDNAKIAGLLLEAGADVNAMCDKGITAIEIAAALGHAKVLETLCAAPLANINTQDHSGNTPFHRAVKLQNSRIVRTLLKYGGDPTRCDLMLLSAVHSSAGGGALSCTEAILRYYPSHVNLRKENGYTALHYAAGSNYVDSVALVASHPSCDINALTDKRQTALHVAAERGHVAVIEKLVGYGADLNIAAFDGTTPLHQSVFRTNMSEPSDVSPQINRIKAEIEDTHGVGVVSSNMMVALFLVSNGADMHVKDLRGNSPLGLCAQDTCALLKEYSEKSNSFRGSLKELPHPFTDPPIKPLKDEVINRPLLCGQSADDIVTAASPTSSPSTALVETRTNHAHTHDSGKKQYSGELKGANNFSGLLNLSEEQKKDILRCFLCDSGVDIKFFPCGHTSMCHECPIAKKCPTCRVPVVRQQAVCVLCQSEKVTRTIQPCGHTYCSECGCGLEYCEACRQVRENSEQ